MRNTTEIITRYTADRFRILPSVDLRHCCTAHVSSGPESACVLHHVKMRSRWAYRGFTAIGPFDFLLNHWLIHYIYDSTYRHYFIGHNHVYWELNTEIHRINFRNSGISKRPNFISRRLIRPPAASYWKPCGYVTHQMKEKPTTLLSLTQWCL